MKKLTLSLLAFSAALSMSACSNDKRTIGPQEAAPAPAQNPNPGNNGGVEDGPVALDENENTNENQNSRQRDDRSDRRRSRDSRPVTPQRQDEEIPVAPWSPPMLQGSPGELWVTDFFNPFLNSIAFRVPQAQNLQSNVNLTIAIGYFDGYHDRPLRNANMDYGRHASADPFLRAGLESILVRPCFGSLQFCGFYLRSRDGVQSIYQRQGVNGSLLTVRIFSGSESVMFRENTGRGSKIQKQRTQVAERLFRQAFRDSSLVIYMGHSRMGGGPDFGPPRLNKKGHVDYPSYQKEKRGEKLLVSAVRDRERLARALAILSCDSTDHFVQEIRSARQLQLVTTNGETNVEGQGSLGIATAELFLRQGHLKGLKSFIANQPKLARFID